MSSSEQRPNQRLADALRAQFRRKSLAISAVSDSLGENRTSCYTWLDRNTFPRDIVLRLAQVAGIETPDLQDLESRFVFETSTPRDRRLSAVPAAGADVHLFTGATNADLFVRLACVEPPEWHPSFWTAPEHRGLLGALRHGAQVLYLIPTDEAFSNWTATTGLQTLPGDGDIGHAFKRFSRTVHAEVPEASGNLVLVRGVAAPFYFPFGTLTLRLGDSSAHAVFDCQTLVASGEVDSTRLVLPTGVAHQAARIARAAIATAALPAVWESAVARLDEVLNDPHASISRR